MKSIKLPVLFLNGNDLRLTELGIKEEEECVPEVKSVIFYRIDAISPHTHDGVEITCIHTAAQDFLCPMKIQDVQKQIDAL